MLCCVTPTDVHAQGGIAVKIQPSTIEEQLDPGDVAEGVITVTNENGGTQLYFIGTQNIDDMTDTGRPIFDEGDPDDPSKLASWITPTRESVTIEVGRSIAVPYRIEIPHDASPGSYHAGIFVRREPEVTGSTGAGVGFGVASLVHLRVNGIVNDDMLLREFYADRSFYTEPHVQFRTRVENTGTIFQRPRGIITITDMLGNNVASLEINKDAGGIMKQKDRMFSNEWSTDDFTLGKYTATADVVFGDKQKETTTRIVSFWIVPIKEVGVMLGGVVVLILLLVFGLRAYVRRELRKAGQTVRSKKAPAQVTFARRMTRTLLRLVVLIVITFVLIVVFFQ
jgi:hypothetical protein